MEEFMMAEEIALICKISKGKAYSIIREINEDLKNKGFITLRGRVNRSYFFKKLGLN